MHRGRAKQTKGDIMTENTKSPKQVLFFDDWQAGRKDLIGTVIKTNVNDEGLIRVRWNDEGITRDYKPSDLVLYTA